MAKLVRLMALIAAAGMFVGTIGCQQEETPESAVDQAVEDAEEGAEETQDAMEDAAEDM